MTAEILSSAAGVLLSLVFAYVPGVREWFEKQDKATKAVVMLCALGIIAAGALTLSCLGWFGLPLTCDKAGIETLVRAFVAALVANQSTFMIAVRPFRSEIPPRVERIQPWTDERDVE